MIVRLISDLHAEYSFDKALYKSQGEDVLVIAGDLHVGANNVWTTLKHFAEHQPNIVYIPGNHEYYKQNYQDFNKKLEDWSKHTSIKFLNPGTAYYNPISKQLQDTVPTKYELEIDDSKLAKVAQLRVKPISNAVAFIGAPLWTNFRNNEFSKSHAAIGINDFKLIEFDDRRFTPNDCSNLFNQHYGYIKHQYEVTKLKKVIVTHFLPSIISIDPKYSGPNTLNDYFANDLSEWISSLENTLFLHGHTHDNVDVKIGSTRIIANPYGYGNNSNYSECLIQI